MKNYVLYLIVALVLAFPIHAALQAPTLDASLLRYEPVPAKPGDSVSVWIQIDNTGDTAAENVRVHVDEGHPFTPLTASDRMVNAGTIPARNSYVTKVQVAVDRNAPDGIFNLPVRIVYGVGEETAELPIEIKSSAASLRVAAVKTNPETLVPGVQAALQVTVENIEESLIRDLTLSLDLTSSVFAPLGSSSQQKISRLEGGSEHTFVFTLVAQPDAAASVYRVPMNISFTTNNGTRFTQQEIVGVIVQAEPELTLVLDESELYQGDKQGTVQIRIVNRGLSEVKFVTVTLAQGEQYEAVGTTTTYVGNIDSDDFETAEFNIKPSEDEFPLNVQLTYRDALNNPYTQQAAVQVVLQERPSEGGSPWLVILVILAVIGGIVWWRRSAKRR